MVIEKIVVSGNYTAQSRYAQRKELAEHHAGSEDAVFFEHDKHQKEQDQEDKKQPDKETESGEAKVLAEEALGEKNPIHVVV